MKKKLLSLLLALAMIVSIIPHSQVSAATAGSTADLTVDGCWANPGDTIDVNVSISGNPGILGAILSVSWDSTMTLVGDTSGPVFSYMTYTSPSRYNPARTNFVWYGNEVKEVKDGVVLTLTFKVSETAKNNDILPVEVTYTPGDVFDGNDQDVTLNITNSYVHVIDYTPGDVTNDGKINTRDLVCLSQYISDGCITDPEGYNAKVVEGACDVNGDGRINARDLIRLSQYISDDNQTDPDGYNAELLPAKLPDCEHADMTATEAKAATCTKDGNDAYWYCAACQKYFSDADGVTEIALADTVLKALGHNVVVVPGYAPTKTETGLTDGMACNRPGCDYVEIEQEIIPIPVQVTHQITYDVANGDPYLAKLLKNGQLYNPNLGFYEEGVGLTLTNLSVEGYRFVGWYDMAENGTLIKKIDANATDDYQLYAYWSKIEYTVQYKSSLFVDRAQDTYTVDTGLVLPTPKLSNYSFTGWADEEGKLYSNTMIPVGTVGNMVLEANWTSERNKTWTNPNPSDPIRYQEGNTMFFVYEIGEIQNVPLYTIKDFGYIAEGGVEKSEETKFSMVISQGTAQQIAESVERATTSSSNWSLSSAWTDSTQISQEWLDERGYEVSEVVGRVQNEESNWNVSTGTNGSTDTSIGASNTKGWSQESKITSSSSSTNSSSINAGLESSLSASGFGVEAEISASLEVEESSSNTKTKGVETGGSVSGTNLSTVNTSTSTGWSNSSSYGGSRSSSESHTASTSISKAVTEKYGYGKSYTTESTSGESQGMEISNKGAEEWSSSVTYNIETAEEVTRSWTTEQTKAGYHRWIMAGIAHVFAVVTYDMETQSYCVYTYTVMDDKTYEFEDYSYTSAQYNDHENGVISFEIPYEVAEMVAEQTVYTQGLKVDQTTGIITGYEGTDNCVVIPEYMNVGGGDVVKVTGIKEGAFQNKTHISAVVLPDNLTTIPNDCFNGCTNLEGITGGSITSIEDRAFAGTAIPECVVRSQVTHVGDQAFTGVGKVYFNCANAKVLEAADNCGAEEIYIDLDYLKDIAEADNIDLVIPAGTEYFEIDADGETVNGMTISSDAKETVFTKINLVGTSSIPVKTSSEKVVFNQSSVTAPGMALVLTAEQTDLYLQSTIKIASDNDIAILGKSVALHEFNPNVDGWIQIKNKLLYVESVENADLISNGVIEQISAENYDNMLNPCVAYFDANGGSVALESKVVYKGQKYGTLPTPERKYYAFTGWYTEAVGGELVTADTEVTTKVNHTLYAHWEAVTATLVFNANGGQVSQSEKLVYLGNKVGSLPVPTRTKCTFLGWYNVNGEKVTEATVLSDPGNITLKAHWETDWVLASALPSGVSASANKWTYNLTTRTTSNSATAPAGFSAYKDPTWVWGEYGAWSSWSKTAATASDSRKVETKTVTDKAAYTNYKYWVYRTSDGWGYGTKNYQTGSHGACTKYDEINLTYALPVYNSSLGTYGPYNSSMFSHSGDSYWFFEGSTYVPAVTHTEYRYADRSKVYTYYYQKIEAKESATAISASDTVSNVQHLVKYVID